MAFHSDLAGKRVLITGASGFTGRYVVDRLNAAGCEIYDLRAERIDDASVNLLNRAALSARVSEVAPQLVVHLAAISFVAHGDAEEIYSVNVVGTRNLLEALARLPVTPSNVLIASSANVYGNASGILGEDASISPQNDYAVSKLAMEMMARQFTDCLPMTIVRPFNYTGVGQSQRFLIPKIVSHFRRRAEQLELGNINVSRDFNDVRNVAEIYARLIALPGSGEVYNICSGEDQTLLGVLDIMEEIADYRPRIVVNPALVRANEVRRLVGNPAKINSLVGDLPRRRLKETLQWMYDAMPEEAEQVQ